MVDTRAWGPRLTALIALAAGLLGWASAAEARPFAYVANSGTDDVTPFAIKQGGRLVASPPLPVGATPQATAATPDGRYLYVALDGDAVAAFAIAPDGGLTELPGSPFQAGLNPRVPAVSPDGSHLYIANFGSDTIGVYAIGPGGGLTPAGSAATEDGPSQVVIAPDGDLLYAPNFGSDSVSAFTVGPDGGLSPLAGPPFPAGDFPANAAISPDGSKLYVSNRGTPVNPVDTISGYTVAASGALAPIPGSPWISLLNPDGLAFTADGSQLYSAGGGSDFVARYSVAPNGALTPTPGGAATGPTPGALFTDPAAGSLFAVNAGGPSGSVSGYAIGPSGLTPAAGSPFPTGGSSPTGRSVAVADTDDRAELRLRAKRSQRVKGRRVAVKVKVSSPEAVEVKLAGGISGGGLKRSRLKPRTVAPVPSEPLVVKLKPRKRRAATTIAKRLAGGGKAKARIKAVATDELGNVAKRSAKVKLKPGRHR